MGTKRTAKQITDKETLKMIFETEDKNMSMSFFMELFGDFGGKRRCNPYDIIIVPKDSYGPEGNKNTNQFTTTAGLYIFNKYFIERDLFDIFGYINKTITGKEFEKLCKTLTEWYLEDRIDVEVYKRFYNKTQKTMPYVSILSPTFTSDFLTASKKITIKKKELIKKYSKELEAGDTIVADKVQKELMAYAKDLLKDDPSMDTYDSDARGSFGNNYKNMYIMKGTAKNANPKAEKQFVVLTSNLVDGVSEKEYPYFANGLVEGAYSRGKKTEKGGYWEKLFLSAFQHVKLDKEGSDCGTKRTLEITLTENVIDMYMYSYIVEGSKLVELNSTNKNKYLGKTVKMRYSALCESKTGYCNKCVGNLFYKLGTTNIGTATPAIPAKLKLISMTAFHDSQYKLTEIDPMEAFSLK